MRRHLTRWVRFLSFHADPLAEQAGYVDRLLRKRNERAGQTWLPFDRSRPAHRSAYFKRSQELGFRLRPPELLIPPLVDEEEMEGRRTT